MVRVVVVDDSATMRAVVTSYLAGDDRVDVVAAYPSAAALLDAVAGDCPDVVVLDDQMRGGDGIDALPDLRRTCSSARIVMFTSSPEIEETARARGADDCVDKGSPLEVLLASVLAG